MCHIIGQKSKKSNEKYLEKLLRFLKHKTSDEGGVLFPQQKSKIAVVQMGKVCYTVSIYCYTEK